MLSHLETRATWRASPTHCVGHLDAEGTSSRMNTVLYAVPKSHPPDVEVVVFPGDGVANPAWHTLVGGIGSHPHSGGLLATIQERLHREGGVYANAAVYVVEPASVARGHAVFSNLLPRTTATGEPDQGYPSGPLLGSSHLSALLAATRAHASSSRGAAVPPSLPLIACGFSKGAVVCNQLLAELAALRAADVPAASDEEEGGARLLQRLVEVHLLDAGLCRPGSHLTDAEALRPIGRAASPPCVCFHGTPRQWRDPARPWLVEEKDRSIAAFQSAGVTVAQREYLQDSPLTLETHFALVEAFDPCLIQRL